VKSRNAFTLVELLVVIGIIAVLISILLPTLARARESANSITCSSNLRQLGLATFMYAHDNRGFFPPGYVPTKVTKAGTEPATFWPVRLEKYVKSTGFYICPSRLIDVTMNTYQANGSTWMFWDASAQGYPFSGPGGTGRKTGPTKLASIRHPTQVVMFTEQTRELYISTYWGNNIMVADFQGQFMYDPSLIYGMLSGGRHFRKPLKGYFWGTNNFVMVDGSVRTNVSMRKIVDLSKPGRWLGYPIQDVNRISDTGYPGTIPVRPTNGDPLDFWLVPWW
jgi:prepilin-type N-terminal cleavage/methylation domain-containing protein